MRISPERIGGCCVKEELDFGALEEEEAFTEEELEEELDVFAEEEETAAEEPGTSQGSDQQK